ncbi:MAG: hypothetical protein JSU94_09700 [Phycisphaerales bacterium]|nr:MAG: hypothetical protein JSU94_09700 [Phycisphaerales bacterium]
MTMAGHILTGFGFGPIQAGLFAKEAFESGNFARIVVAEIDSNLVDAVRANNGCYHVNVAGRHGIETLQIERVQLLNPTVDGDKQVLLEALACSTEMTTSLPSVNFYECGGADSVASMIGAGLKNSSAAATIVYTAENNNRAAEILAKAVTEKTGGPPGSNVQFLNTVIGKMSRVVNDPDEIAELGLRTIAPGIERAFLVEQFNRILVTRSTIAGFRPGIEVFIEKDDLLAFEEAKLYGHNAVHSLLGFLGAVAGCAKMTELKQKPALMRTGREAFLVECGGALVKKYRDLGDQLFTDAGFNEYAEDLLERITNPFLADTVARATRDTVRKLGMDDRIFGTMQLALEYGIEPTNMSVGAAAGLAVLLEDPEQNRMPADLRLGDWRGLDKDSVHRLLDWLWKGRTCRFAPELAGLVLDGKDRLKESVS